MNTSMRLVLLILAVSCLAPGGQAQSSNPQILYTTVAPSGTCSSTAISLLTPDGTVYTCQNGLWSMQGGGAVTPNQLTRVLSYHFDGQGSPLAGTITGCLDVNIGGTLISWAMESDVSGSATIGVHYVARASYTGIAGYAGYTNLIGTGTPPSLSSAAQSSSTTLTNWTTNVVTGNKFCFQLSGPSTVTWVNVYLYYGAN
jgi:hypothetical protein